MASTAHGQGEAEPLRLAGDVPAELAGEAEGTRKPHRGPRWWAALGAAALAGAGVVAAVARTSGPAAAPVGQKLVRLEEATSAAISESAQIHCVFQDFKAKALSGGHPDFEPGFFQKNTKLEQTGLVQSRLHPKTGFPVWNDCQVANENLPCTLSTQSNFDEWWAGSSRSVRVEVTLPLEEKYGESGVWEISRPNFFPLDGLGHNDVHEYLPHNYYFTMRATHTFVYHGGEFFRFKGDDDLWVFFNERLAIDVGGMHTPIEKIVELDAVKDDLALEVGKTVVLAIFFAERAFSGSNFIIETNIQLNQDACYEYDRVLLKPTSAPQAVNSLPNALSWEGVAVSGGLDMGISVTFSFKCEGDCDTNQPASTGHFAFVSLEYDKTMPLSIEIANTDGSELVLPELYITFYDLEDGMAVEAEGVNEYTMMTDSYIQYEKMGTLDTFASSAPAGMTLATYPDELTEEMKKLAVSIKFTDLEKAKVTLKNFRDDGQAARFKFTLAPMFKCVPCFPACEANVPVAATRTTTTTTLTTATLEPGAEVHAASAEEEAYQCCVFDHFGISLGCFADKQWWMPWCPGEVVYPWASWR
ncbi:unnamed protein product [Prorocentrum cordatum]|uniref:PA14 domain-containing protein n=1 Tax=Prorocentrum cordatum TaxID=2364126 RepID=A0ABN9VHG1_9DINO|nr:unnamed protein product [Polarella glacialis]